MHLFANCYGAFHVKVEWNKEHLYLNCFLSEGFYLCQVILLVLSLRCCLLVSFMSRFSNLLVSFVTQGVNVEKNLTKAKILLEKAVAKNSSFAYNVLGFIEINFNHNVTKALEYWKKGLEGGDLQSSYNYASVMEQFNMVSCVYFLVWMPDQKSKVITSGRLSKPF